MSSLSCAWLIPLCIASFELLFLFFAVLAQAWGPAMKQISYLQLQIAPNFLGYEAEAVIAQVG